MHPMWAFSTCGEPNEIKENHAFSTLMIKGTDPSTQCQAVLDLWCNAGNACVSVCRDAGDKVPLVARHDNIDGGGGWKCFSPSALDPSLRKYTGGPAYCSFDQARRRVCA